MLSRRENYREEYEDEASGDFIGIHRMSGIDGIRTTSGTGCGAAGGTGEG